MRGYNEAHTAARARCTRLQGPKHRINRTFDAYGVRGNPVLRGPEARDQQKLVENPQFFAVFTLQARCSPLSSSWPGKS